MRTKLFPFIQEAAVEKERWKKSGGILFFLLVLLYAPGR
jgi:hypothetical protein